MATAGSGFGRGQQGPAGGFAALNAQLQTAAVRFGQLSAAATIFGSSLNAFRELERQLKLTNAVAGGTAEDFERLEQVSRQFALAYSSSAAETANALYFLASAGFEVEESIGALNGVLLLSQATLTNVGETSDILASTIRAFGLEAEDAGDVADIFASSISNSQATLEKLGFALRQVGPPANAFGLSLEETTVALSLLFQTGLRGEQAGTGLRNVLTRLVGASGEARQALVDLGITVEEEGTRKFIGLENVLRQLAKVSPSESTLKKIFGDEALASITALIDSVRAGTSNIEGFSDAFSAMAANIEDRAGSAFRIAAEQLNSLDGSLKLLRNSLTEAGIVLGGGLADPIRDINSVVLSLARGFNSLDQSTQEFLVKIPLAIAAFYLLIKVVRLTNRGVAFLTGLSLSSIIDGWSVSIKNFSKEWAIATGRLTTDGREFFGNFKTKAGGRSPAIARSPDTGRFERVNVLRGGGRVAAIAGQAAGLLGPIAGIAGTLFILKDLIDTFNKTDTERAFENYIQTIESRIGTIEQVAKATNNYAQAFLDFGNTLSTVEKNITAAEGNLKVFREIEAQLLKEFEEQGGDVRDGRVIGSEFFGTGIPEGSEETFRQIKATQKYLSELINEIEELGDQRSVLQEAIKRANSIRENSPASQQAEAEEQKRRVAYSDEFQRSINNTVLRQQAEITRIASSIVVNPQGIFDAELNEIQAQADTNIRTFLNELQNRIPELISRPELRTDTEFKKVLNLIAGLNEDGSSFLTNLIEEGATDQDIVNAQEENLNRIKELIGEDGPLAGRLSEDDVTVLINLITNSVNNQTGNVVRIAIEKLRKAGQDLDLGLARSAKVSEDFQKFLANNRATVLQNALGFNPFDKDSIEQFSTLQADADRRDFDAAIANVRLTLKREGKLDDEAERLIEEAIAAYTESIDRVEAFTTQVDTNEATFRLNEILNNYRISILSGIQELGSLGADIPAEFQSIAPGGILNLEDRVRLETERINRRVREAQFELDNLRAQKEASPNDEEIDAQIAKLERVLKILRALADEEERYQRSAEGIATADRQNVNAQLTSFERNNLNTGSVFEGISAAIIEAENNMRTFYEIGGNLASSFIDQASNDLGNWFVTWEGGLDGLRAAFASTLQSLAADLASFFAKQAIIGGFKALFPGIGGILSGFIGSAKGNVFTNGDITAYAKGGVVNNPTPFLARNGFNIMGEVPGKSEGIFPLQRMGNGELGVRAAGGGSNTLVYQPTYQMSFGGNIGGGEDATASQEALGNLSKQLDTEIEKKVRQVMTRAVQPGGLLNKGPNRRR